MAQRLQLVDAVGVSPYLVMCMLISIEVVTVYLQHMINTLFHYTIILQPTNREGYAEKQAKPTTSNPLLRDPIYLMFPLYCLHEIFSIKLLSHHKIINRLSTYSVGPQ